MLRLLELFGSAAAGQNRPDDSDLDFLVEFAPLPSGTYADAFFGLMESLESLFGQPVDLVVSSRCPAIPLLSSRPWNKPKLCSMQLETKKYLYDIQQAANRIAEFTAGQRLEDYRTNAMQRAAVERQFEIIGEALAKLSKLDETLTARISEHRRIVAFRNILIHGYADVDDRLVWDVVETKLPVLRREIAILQRED